MRRILFAALLVMTASSADAAPGMLQSLTIETGGHKDGLRLAGRDASLQLIVTGQFTSGPVRDLSRSASYESSPAGLVAIDATGLVTSLKEGKAVVTVKSDGASATATITVTNLVNDLPVNFTNQVAPIFTKFGCNAGACHGKADGQNGFKLSLLGFEAAEDYEFLTREARGRRIAPSAPEASLLLRKAIGAVPHGGGKKLDASSPYYRILKRWIEQGTPFGGANDPAVVRIEVLPRERLLDLEATQQLVVLAHHSDGSVADVTRMTQFETNVPELAEVSGTGLVNVKRLPGSAAIMVRYQSFVDVFRATVPLGAPVENLPAAKNFIDEHVFKRLKQLGLPPSDLCDDATFLRRATLDIAGRLPTKDEAAAFVADKAADKREKLIDRLLDSKDYADFFANKWGAILRNRRQSATDGTAPTTAFHNWIRDSLLANKPYDQFVREVLTATGEEIKTPPVVWFRELKDPTAQMEDVAQLFLGQRIACAKCHHHPFEKWSQNDYYGFAAFFTRVEVKDPQPFKLKKGVPLTPKPPATVAHKPGTAEAQNPRSGKMVKPTGLGAAAPMTVADDADPRLQLADWMADKNNPFFARTLANRYWKHFLGRGLVDPEDDMRATNPATNPELLDALAKHFQENKYDLKGLIRTICTSQTYQLSAVPNRFNADDRQNYSRYLPKRLNAEVLLDAIDDVTGARTTFKGAPSGTRAVQLPDNLFDSYFLSVFGRPDAASACECERNGDASLAQCLHMFNSAEILGKTAGKRASELAKDKRPHEERLRDLYLIALSREPSKEELATLVGYLDKKKDNVQQGYEDVIWALVNTKEFLFNH